MDTLLTHPLLQDPAFQSGIAPLLTALAAGLLLKRAPWYWAGITLVGGFAVTVALTVGFQFSPLSSTRKIILLGFGAAAVGLALDLYPYGRRWLPAVLFAAGAGAALWMLWPVLQRRGGSAFWMLALTAPLYAGWCAAAFEGLRGQATRLASGAAALALGTGLCALFGASALLGQLGLGLGAAAGGLWLISVLGREARLGSVAALSAGLLCGLLGVAATVFAKVPWYSLAVLALVPALVRVPLPLWLPRLAQGFAVFLPAAVAAAAAVLLTWQTAGAPPL
ncbi:MAG TPA: hypothetical protein ENJ19_07235 [Gammaproteobacteria bacterium]|nr:hypothetical protein [Gammaproteobacteria bacterium]